MKAHPARLAAAVCLLAAGCLSGCGQDSSSAAPPVPDMGLGLGGCDSVFPDVTLLGEPPLVVKVGEEVNLTARITPSPASQIVRMQFVVAVPGTLPNLDGDPTSAELPSNQLAVSDVVPAGVADGQQATLVWTPKTTGTFPVIDVEYVSGYEDCSTPPPDEADTGNAGLSESELTTITVS